MVSSTSAICSKNQAPVLPEPGLLHGRLGSMGDFTSSPCKMVLLVFLWLCFVVQASRHFVEMGNRIIKPPCPCPGAGCVV